MASGMDMRLDEIMDAAADGFYQEVEDKGVYFTGKNQDLKKELGKAQAMSVKLSGIYALRIAPKIMPLAAEIQIEAQHPDLPIPFSGTIDVIHEDKTIIDLKTARQKWRSGKEKETVQPAVYQYMASQHFKEPFKFGFHVMAYTEETQYIPADSNQEIGYVVNIVKAMLNSIKTGVFMPAVPGHWLCQPKFCGYHGTCLARKGA